MKTVDRWLFAPMTRHRGATVRALLAATIGLRVALGPYRHVGGQPDALFRPPPLLSWLPHMPSTGVLAAVQVAGVLAVLCVLARVRPAAAFAVAWLCLLFLAGCKDSLGKILHNDVLLLLSCVPVLLVPGGARVGDRRPSPRSGAAVRGAMVVIAVAYFAAGMQKVVTSGISWVTSDNMRWILYQGAASGRQWSREIPLAIAGNAALSHLLAAGLLATELSAPLILWWRRFRPAFVALVVVLHLGTWLTLGLDYWGWILTVAVVLFDWDRVPSERRDLTALAAR